MNFAELSLEMQRRLFGVSVDDLRKTEAGGHVLVGRQAATVGSLAGERDDFPGPATIERAGLLAEGRVIFGAGMELGVAFVVAGDEPHHQLIAPGPHAVVGRPARETPGFGIDGYLLHEVPLSGPVEEKFGVC